MIKSKDRKRQQEGNKNLKELEAEIEKLEQEEKEAVVRYIG